MIYVKSASEVAGMRDACRLAAEVLTETGKNVSVGITTKELENVARKKIKALDAKSAFLGYRNYPGVICTSVNEVVVHGVPSSRKLKDGDIVGIDIGVKYGGFYGDTAKTFAAGKIPDNAKKLLETAKLSLTEALENCFAVCRLGDISSAIQKTAERNGFSVVRDFVGHGIGRNLHEDPQIPNYGNAGTGPRLPENCCLAVEVMINEGTSQIKILSDKWTAVTFDSKLSAHFEHTILVKKNGCEILTKYE